jgi:choline monooxygenase
VLRSGWQYIGSASDVADAGTFTTAEIAGLPIVVTRAEDGQLRGFANVCRHRGAVVAQGCGRRKTLQCMYHGWTYRLDGSLHRTPGMEIDSDTGLVPIAVAEFGPLLFASGSTGVEPLADHIAPFAAMVRDIAGIDMQAIRYRERTQHVIEANWKAVVENFIECYHCPLVHSETLPGYGDEGYRVGQLGLLHTQDLASERFCFAYLFPSTQVSAFGAEGAIVARAIQPDGPTRTKVALDFWFEPDVADDAAAAYVAWFERVIGEDKPMCESAQRGFASGAIERGLLNVNAESGLCEFQRLLVDALGDTVA